MYLLGNCNLYFNIFNKKNSNKGRQPEFRVVFTFDFEKGLVFVRRFLHPDAGNQLPEEVGIYNRLSFLSWLMARSIAWSIAFLDVLHLYNAAFPYLTHSLTYWRTDWLTETVSTVLYAYSFFLCHTF